MNWRSMVGIAVSLSGGLWSSPVAAQEPAAPVRADSAQCELTCRAREVECRRRCPGPPVNDPEARGHEGARSACESACDVDSVDCYDQCVPPMPE